MMDIIYYLRLLLVSTRNPHVHPHTHNYTYNSLIYIYIYIFNAGTGFIGTGTTFLYTREKIRLVKNLTCNCAHMYKLTPMLASYRVLTYSHMGKICMLSSLIVVAKRHGNV